MKSIIIGNIPVELEKKKIKNMYLKVLPPEGRVLVTAPIRMSEAEIHHFVLSKIDWIHLQQEKVQQRHIDQERNYITGEEIYIWGKRYTLKVIEKSARPMVDFEENNLIIHVKQGSTAEQRKKIIDSWYKEELMRVLPALIIKWESFIGVKSSGFRIRDMKTRWGTCNIRNKNICFSLQLAKKNSRCLEYVVVHELVHLLEPSHNSVFKGYLDQFMPNWRLIKKEMNGTIS